MLELKVHDGSREVVLQFEHSLLSLSKWESNHKKAFLGREEKLPTEMIEYFQDMLVSPEVEPDLVYLLSPAQLDELAKYINADRTASYVPPSDTARPNSETVTSELIYYWLVALKIPFQPTETWHLSRLLMLVQITNFKAQPPKKGKVGADTLSKWKALNEARKKKYGTNG